MPDGKRVLITGASAGIGRELAHLFARGGYALVLVSRNEARLCDLAEELQRKYQTQSKIIAKDLSRPGAASEIFIELREESLPVEILVNNAGFGGHGRFVDTDLATELEMIELNLTALTHLAKLFLKPMIARGSGKILNVASTAAFFPGPLMAVYYATKAYVLSFSEALAEELQGTGVTVTCLCPGPTATEFQKRARLADVFLLKGRAMDAKTVAEIGYRALRKGKRVAIAGLGNRLAVAFGKLFPRVLVARAVKRVQTKLAG